MLNNLLASTAEKTRDIPISEAALYALLGYFVVFVGIAFLVLIVWLVGKVLTKSGGLNPIKKEEKEQSMQITQENIAVRDDETVSEETVAVIMAALMAYYQQVNPKCEFTVRRIKRI